MTVGKVNALHVSPVAKYYLSEACHLPHAARGGRPERRGGVWGTGKLSRWRQAAYVRGEALNALWCRAWICLGSSRQQMAAM